MSDLMVLSWGMRRTLTKLSAAQKRNLAALPREPGNWLTVSEMRSAGATGSGLDILHVMHSPKLCDRRWTRWGGEQGQKRGEGYEYSITKYGVEIRELLNATPSLNAEIAGMGDPSNG